MHKFMPLNQRQHKKEEAEDLTEGNEIKHQLGELEPREREIKAQIEQLLLALPNLPDDSAPIGSGEEDNVPVRRWGDLHQSCAFAAGADGEPRRGHPLQTASGCGSLSARWVCRGV